MAEIDDSPYADDSGEQVLVEGVVANLIRDRAGIDGPVFIEEGLRSTGYCETCFDSWEYIKVYVGTEVVFDEEFGDASFQSVLNWLSETEGEK